MNVVQFGWLILGLVAALYLVGVILAVFFPSRSDTGPSAGTRIMLVLLRLAIAWHFFIEGMDKLNNPNWTSEAYLREASGPLAPQFRQLTGDRLAAKLTVGADNSFPEDLDRDWQAYQNAFQKYYALDEEQAKRAELALKQTKDNVAYWLSAKKKQVEKIGPYPPALQVSLTMPERLQEYRALQDKAEAIEKDLMVHYGSDAFEAYKTAKASVNKWRAGLQKDLALVNREMKASLKHVLFDHLGQNLPQEEGKKVQEALKKIAKDAEGEFAKTNPENWDDLDRIKEKADEKTLEAFRAAIYDQQQANPKAADERDAQSTLIVDNVLAKKKKDQAAEPLPFAVTRPVSTWTLLDWADLKVKYGIPIVGLLLLVGLFMRTACVVGATFLLMFFLAMPPLPGWPESPRAEGHYLFINKNIIEMLALLTLATTRSGRWAGLDGLVQFLSPSCWRKSPTLVKIETEKVVSGY